MARTSAAPPVARRKYNPCRLCRGIPATEGRRLRQHCRPQWAFSRHSPTAKTHACPNTPSSYASSCSGTVVKTLNGVNKGTDLLSGLTKVLTYVADGTEYKISLTCSGEGSQASAQALADGYGSTEF